MDEVSAGARCRNGHQLVRIRPETPDTGSANASPNSVVGFFNAMVLAQRLFGLSTIELAAHIALRHQSAAYQNSILHR